MERAKNMMQASVLFRLLCVLLTESMQVAGLAAASAASSTVYALLLLLPQDRGRSWRYRPSTAG